MTRVAKKLIVLLGLAAGIGSIVTIENRAYGAMDNHRSGASEVLTSTLPQVNNHVALVNNHDSLVNNHASNL